MKGRVQKVILTTIIFTLITSFCTEKNNTGLSKNEYSIVGTAITGLLDSLNVCDKKSKLIISDSTLLRPVLLSFSVKELLKYLPDTNSVMEYKLLELKSNQNKEPIESKFKLRNFKYDLNRNTIIFEQRKDEFFWKNVKEHFPEFCSFITFTKPIVKGNIAVMFVERRAMGDGAGYEILLKREGKKWNIVFLNRKWVS